MFVSLNTEQNIINVFLVWFTTHTQATSLLMFMDIMRHDMEHFQEYWPFDVWIAVTKGQ